MAPANSASSGVVFRLMTSAARWIRSIRGTTVRLADGLLQLPFVTPYVTAGMAALGATGLAVSTLTEHPLPRSRRS
jgi:ABC-2 type transport system permease protein